MNFTQKTSVSTLDFNVRTKVKRDSAYIGTKNHLANRTSCRLSLNEIVKLIRQGINILYD